MDYSLLFAIEKKPPPQSPSKQRDNSPFSTEAKNTRFSPDLKIDSQPREDSGF